MIRRLAVVPVLLAAALLALHAQRASADVTPQGPTGSGTVLFHMTDTHVGASSDYDKQKNNLKAWVNYANTAPELTASLSSGDLVEWADSQADFNAYFNEVARLTHPHLTAPGNHDYQSRTGNSYAGYGYPLYGSMVTGDFMLVAVDSYNHGFDYVAIEALLKQNRGRYRLGIIEHSPLYVPQEITCGGDPCSAPEWILPASDVTKFKDLAARYDVEVFFVGHDHVFFYTRDKDVYFEQIASADLGLSNQYVMLYEDGERLAFGSDKNNGSPVFAAITPQRWDSLDLLGRILTAEPVKVKALGDIGSAQFQINGSSWYAMSNLGGGIWSASYDWTRLTRDVNATINIKLTSPSGVERTQGYAVRVASDYPNEPPAVVDETDAPERGWNLGTIALTCSASDDKADITRGEWFVDGVRASLKNISKSKLVTFTYSWDASSAGYGEHLLRCKVSDQFGRVVRTARRSVTITPPPPSLSAGYESPDVLLSWTTGAAGLRSEVWRSTEPPDDPDDLSGSERVADTDCTEYRDEDVAEHEGFLGYRVRTRASGNVYSPLSNQTGVFTYVLEDEMESD